MELKAGYNQTEMGVIPEDWKSEPLGKYFVFKNGLNKSKEFFGYGTPIVNYMDVYANAGIYASYLLGRVEVTRQELDSFGVKKGDVFFTRTSETVDEVGITSVLLDDSPNTVFSGFVLRARPKNDELDNNFKKYCFSSSLVRKQIISKSTYTTRALTNGRVLSDVFLPCPSTKTEQEAIAEALSDADALIGSLEQLIHKKRQIKQGTMQELLTGKKRLPGFSEEWQVKTWGDVILSCSSGATPYRGRPEFYNGSIKWITSGELNYCVINDTIEHISKDAVERTNLKVHPVGTFLMAITGLEAAGTRGSCGIVGSPAATNQSCMAIYPSSELLTEYLYHYYVKFGDELALKYCQGTKQQSYTAQLIRILPITLPPTTEEQKAISDLLSDLDTELTTLEIKLTKARQIKQGMMQELLTGKIRLV